MVRTDTTPAALDDQDLREWAIPADRGGWDDDPWRIEADDWPAPEADEDRFPYPAGFP